MRALHIGQEIPSILLRPRDSTFYNGVIADIKVVLPNLLFLVFAGIFELGAKQRAGPAVPFIVHAREQGVQISHE